jgi:hypothetical protein
MDRSWTVRVHWIFCGLVKWMRLGRRRQEPSADKRLVDRWPIGFHGSCLRPSAVVGLGGV